VGDLKYTFVKKDKPFSTEDNCMEAGRDLTQYAIDLQNKHGIECSDLVTITLNILGSMVADLIVESKSIDKAHQLTQDIATGLEHTIMMNIKRKTEVTRG